MTDPTDHSERSLRFIDFEYASTNFRGYEFGNFFCECYIDNFASDELQGFQVLHDLFPSKQFQLRFFRDYLDELHSRDNVECKDVDEEVKCLMREAHLGVLSSHLFWALWGIIQAEDSNISWGYRAYGVTRFKEYFRIKAEKM